nr:ribosomal protein L20 [Ipomoea batatas]
MAQQEKRALASANRDRDRQKRDFRRLWITRINAVPPANKENIEIVYFLLCVAGAWVSIGVDKPGKEEQREVYQVEPPTKCDIDDTAGVWVSTWVHRSRCCWNFPAKGVAPPEVLCRSHRRSPKLLRHCFCRYRSSEATRAFYRWVAIANEGKAVL